MIDARDIGEIAAIELIRREQAPGAAAARRASISSAPTR